MPISEGNRRALLKKKKKRAGRPRPVAEVSRKLTMKDGELRRFTDRHSPIMLSIERLLVGAWGSNPVVDDRAVAAALSAAILDTPPADELALTVFNDLQETISMACVDVAGEIAERQVWIDGMRAILKSVKIRSELKTGERNYLTYAKAFVSNPKFDL